MSMSFLIFYVLGMNESNTKASASILPFHLYYFTIICTPKQHPIIPIIYHHNIITHHSFHCSIEKETFYIESTTINPNATYKVKKGAHAWLNKGS